MHKECTKIVVLKTSCIRSSRDSKACAAVASSSSNTLILNCIFIFLVSFQLWQVFTSRSVSVSSLTATARVLSHFLYHTPSIIFSIIILLSLSNEHQGRILNLSPWTAYSSILLLTAKTGPAVQSGRIEDSAPFATSTKLPDGFLTITDIRFRVESNSRTWRRWKVLREGGPEPRESTMRIVPCTSSSPTKVTPRRWQASTSACAQSGMMQT